MRGNEDADDVAPPVYLAPDRYVTIAIQAKIMGLSMNAIRCKIKAGVWIERREYFRGPDGHIYIDREGVQRWITRGN